MDKAAADETLRRLARGVREASESEAVARLLERVASGERPELQAALLEAGARALLGDVGREA